MKIVVLTSSPRQNGTSTVLADEFCAGAEENKHEVIRYNVAKMGIKPCIACEYCHKAGQGRCVQTDGVNDIYPDLIAADIVVFVTPLYYYSMSAQLKSMIDRFYAINNVLQSSGKKAYLLATMADKEEGATKILLQYYRGLCSYLNWEDAGNIMALGCWERKDILGTDYPAAARRLGASIK